MVLFVCDWHVAVIWLVLLRTEIASCNASCTFACFVCAAYRDLIVGGPQRAGGVE